MTLSKPMLLAVAVAVSAGGAATAQIHQPKLPVTPGAWVDDRQPCNAAAWAWIFDGQRAGRVFYYATPRMGREPQGDLEAMTGVRRLRNGFIEFKHPSLGELAHRLIKPQGHDRATLILAAPSNRHGMQDHQENLKLCRYTSLSPRMQLALRRFAPTLVPEGSSQATGPAKQAQSARPQPFAVQAAPPAAVTSLPPLGIAAGLYVDERTPCTDPISAFYYDGRRAGVIFAQGGMRPDPIGRPRPEGGEHFLPNAGLLVKVLGPARIRLTIQDVGEPMRLCPPSQIPPSIRRLVP